MSAERVFVGLGSNLDSPRSQVEQALAALAGLPGTRLRAQSSLYRSAPLDAVGPDFINAVAELETTLAPAALLVELQGIEQAQGRTRPHHHAPRTLDLDLLLYGRRTIAEADLTVPHPRLHQRAFVVVPLLELAHDFDHPRLGPLAAMRAGLSSQIVEKLP